MNILLVMLLGTITFAGTASCKSMESKTDCEEAGSCKWGGGEKSCEKEDSNGLEDPTPPTCSDFNNKEVKCKEARCSWTLNTDKCAKKEVLAAGLNVAASNDGGDAFPAWGITLICIVGAVAAVCIAVSSYRCRERKEENEEISIVKLGPQANLRRQTVLCTNEDVELAERGSITLSLIHI